MTTVDLAILRYLARRAPTTASQITAGCALAEDDVGAHLGTLEFLQLVVGRQEFGGEMAEGVYAVTQAGRREAAAART